MFNDYLLLFIYVWEFVNCHTPSDISLDSTAKKNSFFTIVEEIQKVKLTDVSRSIPDGVAQLDNGVGVKLFPSFQNE